MMGLLLLLIACSNEKTLTGRVTDVWGKPLSGATVVVEGVVERYNTDGGGLFVVNVDRELALTQVMVGKGGYIKSIQPVVGGAEEEVPRIDVKLYPEPEKPGFYGVGRDAYVHLKTSKVVMVGTELKHHIGIREYPDAALPHGATEFVFTSTLRSAELSMMNLHLSKLDFVDHTEVKGVLGAMDATVNLFVAVEDVPFDLKALPSRDDYLIVLRDRLEPGMYAFHAQNVLNETDYRIIMDLPKEMQVVFPFESKAG
jgi:hypothetical protein